MNKTLAVFVASAATLFASEASFANSDFIERLINFVIFALILWYFGADTIKSLFLSRTQEISEAFDRSQEEEQRLRREKEKVKLSLEEAKQKASEIVALAKREAYLISQKFENKLEHDIKMLVAHNEQKLQHEQREALEEEVKRVMEQICLDLEGKSDYYVGVLNQGLKS